MQTSLFGDVVSGLPKQTIIKGKTKAKLEDYDSFIDKFTKKNTDDCYTPPAVYDVVKDYVGTLVDLSSYEIMRPFKPNGDFKREAYYEDTLVLDNPPFSIITEIVRWYQHFGIKFFLFAPHLSLFTSGRYCTSIVTGNKIKYENGAYVCTSFLTNLLGDIKVMTCPVLKNAINEVINHKRNPFQNVLDFPNVLLSASRINSDIPLIIREDECEWTRNVGKRPIFGGGYFVGERVLRDYFSEVSKIKERRLEVIPTPPQQKTIERLNEYTLKKYGEEY